MCGKSKRVGDEMEALVPREINGWSVDKEDRFYDSETIFDYINGAGEVYKAYDFQLLFARHFAREDESGIYADIFDMGSSRGAYGVFTHDLEGEDVGIGQDSRYKGGLLSFWKGRYFVSLFAERETEVTKKAVLELGMKIASSITEEGDLPYIVSLLPRENRIGNNVRYFYNHLVLNYHFFIADENILGLGADTHGVFALYDVDKERVAVLLISYPDPEKALSAVNHFMEIYMPEGAESGKVQTEDGKWTVVKHLQNYLVVVFESPTDTLAEEMINKINI